MKSLEARFQKVDEDPKHEGHASIIKFFYAVEGGGFSSKTIKQWFRKLVNKEDYEKKDKDDLLAYASKITVEGTN